MGSAIVLGLIGLLVYISIPSDRYWPPSTLDDGMVIEIKRPLVDNNTNGEVLTNDSNMSNNGSGFLDSLLNLPFILYDHLASFFGYDKDKSE